jgi:hypothetical protein
VTYGRHTFYLPVELVSSVEQTRGEISRDRWIAGAISARLRGQTYRAALRDGEFAFVEEPSSPNTTAERLNQSTEEEESPMDRQQYGISAPQIMALAKELDGLPINDHLTVTLTGLGDASNGDLRLAIGERGVGFEVKTISPNGTTLDVA